MRVDTVHPLRNLTHPRIISTPARPGRRDRSRRNDAAADPWEAVAVIRKAEVIKAEGYGVSNIEHAVPVTERTIFQCGSLGKQFTATVVMLLVEEGKVALSDPLTKFFPDAPAPWKQITVQHPSSLIPDPES